MNNNDSALEAMVQRGTYASQNGDNVKSGEHLRDKYHLTFILLYILGTLSQIPTTFFVTANEYWMYKFRDINESSPSDTRIGQNKTELQANFTSTFTIIHNVAIIVSVLVTMKFIKILSLQRRFIISLSVISSIFVLNLGMIEVNTDTWQKAFFAMTMTLAFILTVGNGVFTLTVYQLAGKFHQRYMAAVISGTAICGITAALTQIFSLAIGASPITTAMVYFSLGTVLIMGSVLTFYLVYLKSTFFYYHFNRELSEAQKEQYTKEEILVVLGKMKWYLVTLVIFLGCTVMVHPAVTSLVVSVHEGNGNEWNDKFFKPVVTFLLYYTIDLVGREAAAAIKWPTNELVLILVGILRLIFIPIFMFCNAQPRHHTKVFFNNDYSYIISIIVFAFSNGYFTNIPILEIPKNLTPKQRKISIFLLLLVMILSLAICSSMNALLVNAL